VAAGSVVKENFVVPDRHLVAGVPARVVRPLTDDEVAFIRYSVEGYVKKIPDYLPE
jgi:carbonic anhydrase/acetyltransferase-like protein (isoleucine patch superfamily)